jgi:regulatory protein
MTGRLNGAYAVALRMLARRELSESQVRARLTRQQFDAEEIAAVLARLRHERALDDGRTARACARTELHVRHRGRLRVLRRVEALGIARAVARAAVDEVFAEVDERALLEQALDRRLKGAALENRAAQGRTYRYLLAQGFEPEAVATALRGRIRHAAHDD